MVTTSRAVVKVTLGWEVAYEFEVWIMSHHAGVDLILGTDFMIPAGIRLDLYNSAVKLPDDMVIPLIRSSNAPTKTEFGPNVLCRPPDGLTIESRMTAEFKLPRRQPRYVRVSSAKYRDWQILAFESAMDKDLLQKEQRLYEDWLSHQPPAVERRKYPTPTAVEKRPPPGENGPELTCAERWRRVEADTVADEDERRVTRGDPAINSAFKLEDVRADRTPVLHDCQDVSYQLSKFDGDGAISDVNTNSAVEGTSAVRANEDVSTTKDSAITEGDPEERSKHVLRDAQPVIDNRAKFGVNSAVSTLTTISVGSNHVVTANSALGEPAARNDLGAVPVCHRTTDYAMNECGRVDVFPAVVADSAVQCPSVITANSKLEVFLSRDAEDINEGLSWKANASSNSDEGEGGAESGVDGLGSAAVVNSAMGTPKACIFQSAVVDSASADWNTESASDVATACRQDISYTEDAFTCTEVRSAVTTNSAGQHSDMTKDYDSREVLLPEGIKPNDDPATADSALKTMETETGSEVVRQHDDDTIYLGDKSAVAVNSANTGRDADDNYDVPEVSLLEGTIAEVGVTNSAARVFDPGGIDYGFGQAEDDECNSTRDPTETLRQHYLAIAATEDEQEDDVDDGTTNAFERSGTNLELTDYAHELAFLPDLTEVEPTELDYGAANVKSSSHTPAHYGALCDIDVQGHAPIKQRAWRIPLRHLSKRYELLKGLLRAGGFWAVLMTRRARQISAFVYALGHFEWLRMPFGLKNAPMIY
ncbi:hypothetical protein PInf_015935 [Phytophthora infestans]|nr:hypothetical protein PInf_015935 [Phytophthora infestans]